ncbi:MAG: hypothetical protein C0402_06125 [Thermodesulfovibrio sp.]|nr:hypothetical protein [Thermodesulfovibrio sp.]
MKILVVDDEQLVRWFLDRALKKGGHEVTTASGIGEAMERLRADRFDLLFVDLRMPEGGGTDLISQLDTLSYRMQVIVCSAYITTDLETEFTRSGICILRKPFKLDELNQALESCLASK